MPATLNFPLTAGDDLLIQLQHIDEATGDPRSLAGAEIRWAFSKIENGVFVPVAVQTKSLGDGITVINELAGTWQIELHSIDTDGRDPGEYYHEAKIVDGAGVNTVLAGRMTLRRRLVPPW
jgi:hypothetical protein